MAHIFSWAVGGCAALLWAYNRAAIGRDRAYGLLAPGVVSVGVVLAGPWIGQIIVNPHHHFGVIPVVSAGNAASKHRSDAAVVLAITLFFAGTVAAIYLSSLIDSFYTSPRLQGSGKRTKRPCTTSLDED